MADFIGNDEVLAAMGSTLIPTAFTARAKADVVLAGIASLNPGVNVSVATAGHQLSALALA